MKMTEETRKLLNAEKDFEKRGHKATLVQNTDRYTVIDWRKADGSGNYYVNYIIDKKRGSLIISGDLGDCIATWYNPNSVHNITEYTRDIYYFIGKFQCSSDRFNWDEDDIIDDIEEELKDSGVDFDDDDFKDDWEEFQDEAPNYVNAHGFFPNGEVAEFLDKYLGDDWWEGSSSWGRTVDPRVYLWVAGLNMAVDQLTEAGLLSEED
jgi:hypothetical protein